MKQVVWVPFSIDRATYTPPPGWVEWRIHLFEQFTLRSMLAQTFDDFEIWLGCGERHRAITDAHDWHPRVRLVYNKEVPLDEIEADFFAISRIDSDDLYRDDALEFIDAEARKRCFQAIRAFVLDKNLLWNRLHGFLGPHRKLCSPPPFVTRIYPKDRYKNVETFHKTFFVPHGEATKRAVNPEPLDRENLCCVVKHGSNTSLVKRGREPEPISAEHLEALQADGKVFRMSTGEIEETLSRYGVSKARAAVLPANQYKDGAMVCA